MYITSYKISTPIAQHNSLNDMRSTQCFVCGRERRYHAEARMKTEQRIDRPENAHERTLILCCLAL
jgi:hypothetical protein